MVPKIEMVSKVAMLRNFAMVTNFSCPREIGDQSNSGGSFGRHPNSNNGDTSSASAFISAENTEESTAENTEESNRTIADIGDNVSPIDGDELALI